MKYKVSPDATYFISELFTYCKRVYLSSRNILPGLPLSESLVKLGKHKKDLKIKAYCSRFEKEITLTEKEAFMLRFMFPNVILIRMPDEI